MSAEVRQLRPLTLEPLASVVEMAQEILRQAEAGEIRAIAYASVKSAGFTSTAYTLGDSTRPELHYAISTVALRLLDDARER